MAEDTISKARALIASGKLTPAKQARMEQLIASTSPQPKAEPEKKSVGQTMAGMMTAPEETSGVESAAIMDTATLQLESDRVRRSQEKLRPPVLQAAQPLQGTSKVDKPVFMHSEPGVDKALAWAKQNDLSIAYADIQRNGKRSKHYEKYADYVWKEIYDTMVKAGRGAVRMSQMNDKDANVPFLQQALGVAGKQADALITGAMGIATFGAGRHLLGALGDVTAYPEEVELQKRGIIGNHAERMQDAAEENPITTMAGGLAGFRLPGSVGGALYTGVAPALGKATTPLLGMMGASGLHGVGEQAVEEIAETARGEGEGGFEGAKESLKRMGQRGYDYAMMGGLGGQVAESLGAFGKAASRKVLDPTKQAGRDADLMQWATGKPATQFPTLKGVGEPEVMTGAKAKYHTEVEQLKSEAAKAAKSGTPFMKPPAEGPIEAITRRGTKAIGDNVKKYLTKTDETIGADKQRYYNSPEGMQTVSVRKVGEKAVKFLHEKVTPEGQEIPLFNKKKLEEVVGKHLINHERTQLINEELQFLKKVGRPVIAQGGDAKSIAELRNKYPGRSIPEALAEAEPMRAFRTERARDIAIKDRRMQNRGDAYIKPLVESGDVSVHDGKLVAWKKLNASNVDDFIQEVDNIAKASQQKEGYLPGGIKELQEWAREARDSFKWAPEMGPEPMATINTAAGRKTVRGWSAMRHRHDEMVEQGKNYLSASGVSRELGWKNYRPDINYEHMNALSQRVMKLGSLPSAERDKMLLDLMKSDLAGYQAMKDSVATNAYMRFTAPSPKVAMHGGDTSGWLPTSADWIGLQVDPLFRAMGKLAGRGPQTAAATAEGMGTKSERRIRDIANMPQEEVDNIMGAMDDFKEAQARGVFEELENKEE